MAKDRTTSSEPIRLNFRNETRVVVEPADEDRFVVTVREAAQACKQAQDNKEWESQFNNFLVYLENWSESHSDTIKTVYVNVADGALNILICTGDELYNVDFDDTITELDLELVKRFHWLIAEVMQVPESVQCDRIPYEKAILVYGDGKRTQAAGGA